MEPKRAPDYGIYRAGEDVIGRRVVNEQGEDLGKIEDVIIDANAARVSYAILSFGGFMGLGDKLFALPWVSLSYDRNGQRFVLKADKELLKKAPGFDKTDWPILSDPANRDNIDRYYDTATHRS